MASRDLCDAAADGRDADVVDSVRRGADLEFGDFPLGNTPLMIAAKHGRTETVRLLLHFGALVNASNTRGETALTWAARHGHIDVAKWLIEGGAYLHVSGGTKNLTPGEWAKAAGNKEVARYIQTCVPHPAAARAAREAAAAAATSKGGTRHRRLSAGSTGSSTGDGAGVMVANIASIAPGIAPLGGGGSTTAAGAAAAAVTPAAGGGGAGGGAGAGVGARASVSAQGRSSGATTSRNTIVHASSASDSASTQATHAAPLAPAPKPGELLAAAEKGDTNAVRRLIKAGANVNTRNESGLTPLVLASINGHHNAAMALVASGANVNQPEVVRTEILCSPPNQHCAAHITSVHSEFPQLSGATPVFVAALNGHTELVRTYLDSGANPMMGDNVSWFGGLCCCLERVHAVTGSPPSPLQKGNSLLTAAAAGGSAPLVRLVMGLDVCDINVVNKVRYMSSRTPAMLCCAHQPPHHQDGATALHHAAEAGEPTVIQLLLEAGADVSVCDALGDTALIVAASNGHVQATRLLLAAGSQPAAMNQSKLNALGAAAEAEQVDVVALLLRDAPHTEVGGGGGNERATRAVFRLVCRHKAAVDAYAVHHDINAPVQHSKERLLTMAVRVPNNEEVVTALLQRGASVNAVNGAGLAPLHVAATANCTGYIAMLVEHGAKVDIAAPVCPCLLLPTHLFMAHTTPPPQQTGETPLMVAAQCGSSGVAKKLLARGANAIATTQVRRFCTRGGILADSHDVSPHWL